MTLDPLDQATDRLNSALEDAEDALADLALGVTASIPLEGDLVLHFKKRSSEWGFVVSRRDDTDMSPLSSKSRRTRLEAASRLHELHEALHDAYASELRRVQRAIEAVNAFTTSVRPQPPSTGSPAK